MAHLNADNLAFPEKEGDKVDLNEVQQSALIDIIIKRFTRASDAKRPHEERMIDAYNNFRGIYGKGQLFRQSEKSRVFVKTTKTKVLAGFGQIVEIALKGEKFPIGISATDIPEGEDDIVHVKGPIDEAKEAVAEPEDTSPFDVGFPGDGNALPPGATFGTKLKRMLGMEPKEAEFVTAGPSPDPSVVQMRPADEAAYKMDKLIQDQMEESEASQETAKALFECVMLGTGVIKGPFTFEKTLHNWEVDKATGKRMYKPVNVRVPRIEFVSVWDAYPDPDATTRKEMSWFIHRHRKNDSQLRELRRMPFFDEVAIAQCLENGPNYVKQSYEDRVISTSEETTGRNFTDRFEVLEYWGVMGVKEAREMGLTVSGLGDLDEVQINAWVCGGVLLRLVQNPFTPARIPYHIFNYEVNPYSIFGVGIPENMSDSQALMNGFARMAIDNLALAGGLVFDVDETALVPGQDMQIYNGKIFYRQAGSTGQAVHGIKFPNTAQENLMMFDKFRQTADEETGIPSFSHGQLGVTGMTRTAAGMSMLMGAASVTIKTVIYNLDNQLFKPLGDDTFQWNMQFYEGDLAVEGDLEVKALGTLSLMQKEVRSQRLTMFLQTAMNPAVAPFIKIPYIIEELAISLDLDKDKILNTTEEARFHAQLIGMQNSGQQAGQAALAGGEQSGPDGQAGGVLQGGGPEGTTGNGNETIGTGLVAQPGEVEFPG